VVPEVWDAHGGSSDQDAAAAAAALGAPSSDES